MLDATPTEIAWAAGLFEGEGSITMRRDLRGYWQRTLSLSMCDRDVLERFARIVGAEANIYADGRPMRRPLYAWRCGRWSVIEPMLTAFLPYLGERRRAKALELLANPARRNGGVRKMEVACSIT